MPGYQQTVSLGEGGSSQSVGASRSKEVAGGFRDHCTGGAVLGVGVSGDECFWELTSSSQDPRTLERASVEFQ